MSPQMHLLDGQMIAVGHGCVNCGQPIRGQARAVITRTATLFSESAESVWARSRNSNTVVEKLCRAKSCAGFLNSPVLPPNCLGVEYVDSIYHGGTVRFIGCPVVEKPWPVRALTFFEDARSKQMRRFFREGSGLQEFCKSSDKFALRCVGAWSSQEEIDAVHHYACLFAQEEATETGVWMPYWFRDARLIGPNRVAYLIKGAESYQGAVMMDTLGYHTVAWAWLTPKLRRRGVFSYVWELLEHYHRGFKILAPLSKAMETFLSHKDPHGRHAVVETTGEAKQ